jgi:hypothetical protein
MTPFIRIKSYVINLQNLAYVHVSEGHIDFAFAFPSEGGQGGRNCIRLVKGSDLSDGDFQEVVDFLMQLPDPDRVIVV